MRCSIMPRPEEHQSARWRPLTRGAAGCTSKAVAEILEALKLDNSFVRELPGDPSASPQRRQVHAACYSRVAPTPVAAPRLVAYSREVAELLGLSADACESEAFAQVFAG